MRVLRTATGALRFIWAYLTANMQAAMEYRTAFWVQVIMMMANDCLWLFFWWSYFQQFPLVNGWQSSDIIVLWAVTGSAFGLGAGVFGNATKLARLITNGGLDAYLGMPRNVLLHMSIGSTSVASWGDVLFSFGAYLLLLRPDAWHLGLFILLTGLGAIMLTAFFILIGSLAFFVGNTESLSGQIQGALVAFCTYPMNIFHGAVRLLLFTVLPAGFISFVPLQLLKQFSWPLLGALVGVTILFVALAVGVFALGLRRYESGSLLGMQE